VIYYKIVADRGLMVIGDGQLFGWLRRKADSWRRRAVTDARVSLLDQPF